MNNLNTVLESLSQKLGVELVAIENRGKVDSPYSIRFLSLGETNSFELALSRSWKTTQIRFIPDTFAGEVIHFLCVEIMKNSRLVYQKIESHEELFSSIRLEVDGRPFFGSIENLSANPSLTLEVEVLTPESSINYGLLNDKEKELVVFTVALISSLLPIREKSFISPDEVHGYPEGATSKVEVNKYERDPRNRREAISIHGKKCLACDFDFYETYGELGEDYVVVHHVVPVSQIGENYKIDPANDLVTVCANCHAMLHRVNPPMKVKDLRNILGK